MHLLILCLAFRPAKKIVYRRSPLVLSEACSDIPHLDIQYTPFGNQPLIL
jgi:hypothetical protein